MFLRLRRLVLCFAVVAAAGAIGYAPKFWSAPRPADVPYGVSLIPGTDNFGTQDFAIHLNFLRQTWHESIRHPYQLEDQERIAKNWYPRMATGFPMAYSPVALVLALPLLAISPESAYFVVTFLNAALLLLLTWLYLLPRMTNSVQAGAVLATLCGSFGWDRPLLPPAVCLPRVSCCSKSERSRMSPRGYSMILCWPSVFIY
jgi:hypothetical protein